MLKNLFSGSSCSFAVRICVICGLLLLLSGCPNKPKQAKRVILISMDTTRADHLSCYGFNKNTTPNIDNFAKDSVLFEQCISPVPFTLPAHSSMMTGTNPVYHGAHENVSYTLAPENTTLAERFTEKGFKTGAVVSTFVLDKQFGMDQGFEFYDGSFENPIETLSAGAVSERRGDDASRVACQWLEKNKDENFFLFLHYYDPHFQYNPPQPFASKFDDDMYSGEIAFTDYCIKQVFDKLKASKIYDDTMVILVGDHGEGLKEHDEQQHGYYIYQGSIHVPMLVHFPGGRYAGKRIDKTVGLIDIAPTVAGWTGLEPLDEYAGMDLTGYLVKKPVDQRYVYSESLRATQYGCSSLLALVSGNWKYIQSSVPEMYDLAKDPVERNNVFEREAKRARVFQDELKLLLTEQVRKTSSRSDVLDPESRRKLESLGYLATSTVKEDFEFDTSKDNPHDWFSVYLDLDEYFLAKQTGNFARAEEYCLRVQKDKPFYVMNYFFLAEVQFNLGKYSEAVETAKEFLVRAQEKIDGKSQDKSVDPVQSSVGPAHHVIGMSCFKLGQVDKAVEELKIALEKCDQQDKDKVYNNFGNIYLAKRQIDLAVESFNKAIELNPKFHEALYNVGLVYMNRQEFEKALQSFAKALQLKPDWEQARQKIEQTQKIIAMQGSLEKAMVSLESDLQKDPRNTDILDKLGSVHQVLGRVPRAVDYWEKSLAIKPDNPAVLNNLAYSYTQKGSEAFDPQKSLEYAQKANELTKHQNPNYLDTLALTRAAGGDFDAAVEVAQQAMALALAQNQTALAESIQKNLNNYRNRTMP